MATTNLGKVEPQFVWWLLNGNKVVDQLANLNDSGSVSRYRADVGSTAGVLLRYRAIIRWLQQQIASPVRARLGKHIAGKRNTLCNTPSSLVYKVLRPIWLRLSHSEVDESSRRLWRPQRGRLATGPVLCGICNGWWTRNGKPLIPVLKDGLDVGYGIGAARFSPSCKNRNRIAL